MKKFDKKIPLLSGLREIWVYSTVKVPTQSYPILLFFAIQFDFSVQNRYSYNVNP